MSPATSRALAIARPAIVILTAINIAYAMCLLALLVWSFFIEGWPARPLGFDMVNAHPWVGDGLRAIVVVGILAATLVHLILRRLLAIVDTVRVGDPFILENAERLQFIAWCVMAGEGLRLVVATIARIVWEPGRI